MDLRSVMKQVALSLDASVEEEAHAFFLTVPTSDPDTEADAETEEDDEDDRTQLVMVELDEEGEMVVVSTDVGPWSEEHDLAEVLRLMRDADYCRVFLSEATEDEAEQLVVGCSLPVTKADAELLGNIVQEVAEVADEMELLLFEDEGDDLDDDDDDSEEDSEDD